MRWRAGLSPLGTPLPHMRGLVSRGVCRSVMLTLGQLVEVEHAERLAAVPEPALFAFNHSTAFEALLVPAALIFLRRGRPLHFLADWMYVEAPGLGWLLRRGDPIPIYNKPARFHLREGHRRERRRHSVLAACLARLERGASIGIFPEGTRNRDGSRLLRGRLGLGELALAAGVPVVPAAIRYPAQQRLGRPPRLGRLVLSIGAPIDCAAERRQLQQAPETRREMARQLVNRVMAALASELGRAWDPYPERRRAARRAPANGLEAS